MTRRPLSLPIFAAATRPPTRAPTLPTPSPTAAHQSQTLNKSLLNYINSDDDSLRARVILSLPQLDLAADVFADMQSRVSVLAANTSENLQVVTAAKAVTGCWSETKMTSGCPKY